MPPQNPYGVADRRELAAFLFTTRQHESGHNYTAQNRFSSASGAYQMIDSTWRSWASQAELDGIIDGSWRQYAHAKDAPGAMQDAVAAAAAERLFVAYGNWDDVFSIWYTGKPLAQAGAGVPAPGAGNTQTPARLVANRRSTMQGYLADPDWNPYQAFAGTSVVTSRPGQPPSYARWLTDGTGAANTVPPGAGVPGLPPYGGGNTPAQQNAGFQQQASWNMWAPGAAPSPPQAGTSTNPGATFGVSPGGTSWGYSSAPTLAPSSDPNDPVTDVGQYGWLAAFMSIPELAQILETAVDENWDPQKLQAEIEDTQWWQTTQSSVRQWIAFEGTDPAEAGRQVTVQSQAVAQLAANLGVPITSQAARAIATNALRLGWTDQEVKNAVLAEYRYNPAQVPEGQLGIDMRQVQQLGSSYLFRISDDRAADLAMRIERGELNPQAVQLMFANQAKARFQWLGDAIDQGLTPMDYFDQHRATIAQTLELDPDAVDIVNDQTFLPVLEVQGENRAMTLAETAQWARNLPQYQKTKQAHDQAWAFGSMLTSIFNKRR